SLALSIKKPGGAEVIDAQRQNIEHQVHYREDFRLLQCVFIHNGFILSMEFFIVNNLLRYLFPNCPPTKTVICKLLPTIENRRTDDYPSAVLSFYFNSPAQS